MCVCVCLRMRVCKVGVLLLISLFSAIYLSFSKFLPPLSFLLSFKILSAGKYLRDSQMNAQIKDKFKYSVIDFFPRSSLSWRLFHSSDVIFCISSLFISLITAKFRPTTARHTQTCFQIDVILNALLQSSINKNITVTLDA